MNSKLSSSRNRPGSAQTGKGLFGGASALEVVHAVGGDLERGAVAPHDIPSLHDVPQGELQVLPRPAGHLLEVQKEHARARGFNPAFGVQNLQDGDAKELLGS